MLFQNSKHIIHLQMSINYNLYLVGTFEALKPHPKLQEGRFSIPTNRLDGPIIAGHEDAHSATKFGVVAAGGLTSWGGKERESTNQGVTRVYTKHRWWMDLCFFRLTNQWYS